MPKYEVSICENAEFEADNQFEAEELAREEWRDSFRAVEIEEPNDDTE